MKCKILLLFLIILSLGCVDGKIELNYPLSKTPHERTPIDALDPFLRAAVLRGEAVMKDENLGTNGLSCASCHPNPELNKVWAALFPRRWASTMNPEHRVITLAQHNYGAYHGMMGGDLSPEYPSFTDLNAYLMWLGDGTRIWEEETPGRFQVTESALRGKNLFYDESLGGNGKSCSSCHSEASMKGVASVFPKYSKRYERVVILDTFIKIHAEDRQDWEIELEGQEISDMSTFLTNLSRDYVISLERG